MSTRWAENFQNHSFRAQWVALKSHLKSATVDDKSVNTFVSELGRLKKVISYLDGILDSIDPDLVPLSIWDSFSQQAAQCVAEISAYNTNRNIGHIQNANANADNLLTYIRPYMAVAGKLAKGLRESAAAYSSAFVDYSASFKEEADEIFSAISRNRDEIEEIKREINNVADMLLAAKEKIIGEDGKSGEIGSLESKISEFLERYKRISEFYEIVFDGSDEYVALESSIQEAAKTATAMSEKISDLSRKSTVKIAELSSFHEKVFGAYNESGERQGGFQAALEKAMADAEEFERQQNLRYTTLYQQIEGLLPGATSAGLASSCGKMKTTFDAPIRTANYIFYGAIAALVMLATVFAVDKFSLENGIELIKYSDWQAVLGGLALKLPFFAPFVWLAYYASSRRSEFQRLQQEYAHKEVVANSYQSYKQQIDALGDLGDGLLSQLLEKAILAISYNASETLDKKHGDKMPMHTVVEKLVETADKLTEKIPKP